MGDAFADPAWLANGFGGSGYTWVKLFPLCVIIFNVKGGVPVKPAGIETPLSIVEEVLPCDTPRGRTGVTVTKVQGDAATVQYRVPALSLTKAAVMITATPPWFVIVKTMSFPPAPPLAVVICRFSKIWFWAAAPRDARA